jgi:hypothetical protein
MSVEQDLTAARAAIDALEQSCSALARHFPDTVDSRRLRVDVARLREDLILLVGTPERPVHDPYAASFYDDGYDQSMDSPGRRTR